MHLLPIQYITIIDVVINKLVYAPTPVNAYQAMLRLHTLENYNSHANVDKIVILHVKILQIYLVNKEC